MSTEDINKVVVTLKKGVDVDAFIDEMVSIGNRTDFVPSRAVELYNEKPESLRNVDFVMTREEAFVLENDPRVEAVRFGSKQENGLIKTPFSLDESRLYRRVSSSDWASGNVDMNWGMACTINTTNPYNTLTPQLNLQLPFTATGNGVDFVVQDSGLQVNHPEFTDSLGISRVQQVNWYTLTGYIGTMPANFYTDADGHGTHVCGSAAGKTYGWAREASIYVMNILGVNANSTISDTLSFNMLRQWHTNKSITSTGYKRPTVVNMSWGYTGPTNSISGGVYRGTPWTGSGAQPQYGVVNPLGQGTPVLVASVEADVEDCLDAGVILIAAAGNSSYKIDIPGGVDYDNTIKLGSAFYYYMRGTTPNCDPRVIRVGAVSDSRDFGGISGAEGKTTFSNTGPGVGIYVGGAAIVSSYSNVYTAGDVRNYPYNSSFKSAKISGTSMASPQVAGIVCLLMQARPWYNMERIQNWIYGSAIENRLTTAGSGYTDYFSLQGGPNRYLYYPWSSGTYPTVIQHTIPAKIDEGPEYTAVLHGRL